MKEGKQPEDTHHDEPVAAYLKRCLLTGGGHTIPAAVQFADIGDMWLFSASQQRSPVCKRGLRVEDILPEFLDSWWHFGRLANLPKSCYCMWKEVPATPPILLTGDPPRRVRPRLAPQRVAPILRFGDAPPQSGFTVKLSTPLQAGGKPLRSVGRISGQGAFVAPVLEVSKHEADWRSTLLPAGERPGAEGALLAGVAGGLNKPLALPQRFNGGDELESDFGTSSNILRICDCIIGFWAMTSADGRRLWSRCNNSRQSIRKSVENTCGNGSGLPSVIFEIKPKIFWASNGTWSAANSYKMHPRAQMSLANEYTLSLQISGLK